jgi:hypothetical protein
MRGSTPLASLSLDLDNKWSYLKTHGEASWASFPTYLPTVVPRILDFLRERGLRITFFVVGQDADLAENRVCLRAISDAGHEIGNHSYNHEPWLHLYSEEKIAAELQRAEEVIVRATGQRPVGFRGPGFSLSEATLNTLVERGYRYDASTFPTFLGPLARAYYFMTAKLSKEEQRERSVLFGTLREGLRPNGEYRWQTAAGSLLEIPVTVMPFIRSPFHVSYLLYLSLYSPRLARCYFALALRLCGLAGVTPSLLLHPLDFMGCDDTRDLSFFPAMGVDSATKLNWLSEFLRMYTRQYRVVSMREHAEAAVAANRLRHLLPTFPRLALPRFAMTGGEAA